MHPPSPQSGPPQQAAPRIVGAIPARYASTRLPGKPLRELAGRPLIEHVWRKAQAAERLDRVVILTDDQRIAAAVEGFGGECQLTPTDCASGTDRIAWAARDWECDAVVNIQGDEPLIEPGAIDKIALHLAGNPDDAMVTLAAPASAGDSANPDVVKVVLDRHGFALYFSRAAIPHPRRQTGATPLRHIGIYGYQAQALQELSRRKPTPLEQAESLEQLRALETGIRIRVLQVAGAWEGVDTIGDLERIERLVQSGRLDLQDTKRPNGQPE